MSLLDRTGRKREVSRTLNTSLVQPECVKGCRVKLDITSSDDQALFAGSTSELSARCLELPGHWPGS